MRHVPLQLKYILTTALIISVTAVAFIALGQRTGDTAPAATVARLEGFVDILHPGADEWTPLAAGEPVSPGDTIETGPEGVVELNMPDGSALLVGPSSSITINEIGTVEVTGLTTNSFQLLKGKIRAIVPRLTGSRSLFIINTENVSVGVRGTDFFESFDPDTTTTYLLGLDGCVSMTPREGAAFDVCAREETSVGPGVVPTGPRAADEETIREVLRDMPMNDVESPGDVIPPEITGAVINGIIDLDYYDDEITLIRDHLTADGAIRIEGTAGGGSLPLDRVEISTDGGLTWNTAAGAENWTGEIRPAHDTTYDVAFRAIDTGGNAGDPMDMGPFEISYRDIDADTLAREALDRLFDAVRLGDGSDLDDIISDLYDGDLAGLYDKDELINKLLDDQEAWPYMDFSYRLNRLNSGTNTIIVTVHWDIPLPGGIETGTTRWWLDARDEYRLTHAEGDWIQNLSASTGEINMSFYSDSPPCDNWMIITVYAPNILKDVETINVEVEANCGPFDKVLTRSFYKEITGRDDGFAAEFPVLPTAGCLPTICSAGPPVWYWNPPQNIKATFFDYGYDIEKSVRIP